jgi:hypothetical protein
MPGYRCGTLQRTMLQCVCRCVGLSTARIADAGSRTGKSTSERGRRV